MRCALSAYRCDLRGKNNPKLQNGNIFLHFTCNYHLAHLILSSFFTQCITVTPQNVTDEAKLWEDGKECERRDTRFGEARLGEARDFLK